MSDDLKVAAELSLKDNLTGPASKAVARVSNEARKAAGEQAKSASAARGMADALAQVDRRGQAAARAVGGVAQAMARAAHTPFTTAAAQMQNLQQATMRTRREMAALLKVAGGVGHVVGAGVRVAGGALTSTAGQLAAGVATAGSAAHLVSMDSRYAALKANANMSGEEAAAFKARVQGAAGKALVSESDVLTLAEVVQNITGDKGFYTEALTVMAKAQKASGADAQSVGAMSATLHDIGVTDPHELERTYSGLDLQGSRGAYTLGDLTKYGAGVLSMYSALGHGGKKGAFEANTALQLAMGTTKNAATATTAVDAFLRDLQNAEIQNKLKDAKIDVYDKNGRMRSITDIQKDILRRTGGDMRKFNKLGFSDEGKRAMTFAMGQYAENKNLDFMDKFAVTGDEGTLDRKWRENSDTMESALTALGNSWAKIVDSLFTAPLKAAARAVTGMSEGARDASVALGALGLGALALFAKVKAGQALAGLARKYLAGGGAAEAVEKAARPGAKSHEMLQKAAGQKKNVIQQAKAAPRDAPLKLAPAEGTVAQAVEAAGKSAARGGLMGKALKLARRVPFLNFLFAGGEVAATELDDSLTRAQKNAAHTETAGGLAGTLAGAKAGAVVGTLAGPIGTAIGTAIGGALGFFGGGWLGEKLGNWAFGGDDKAGEAPPLQETVMQAVQLMQSAPIAANLNLTVELDGEVIARKVEQAQLRQATRR